MASIERTAYPKLKNCISQKELNDKYTPLLNEKNQAYNAAKGDIFVIGYLALLKCFQNLGYFLPLEKIPETIIKHIKQHLRVEYPSNKIEYKSKTTLYLHHKSIREYLNIKQYDDEARKMLVETILRNSYIMENPADLINSAIDILIKNNQQPFPNSVSILVYFDSS